MNDDEIMMELHRAITKGNLLELKRLIDEDNSRIGIVTAFGTLLHDAATFGQHEIVRWLLDRGIDVNSSGDNSESTPICEAAGEGYLDIVKSLIDSGANIEVANSIKNPLFAAIVGGMSDSHTAVAKLLIDNGIDTEVRYPNLQNMNALEFADQWGRMDIVALLENK